uniref:Uncharacterized protein n=1 Tax=Lepisosteus oculatus TaxID=7918 RepID=W5M3U7_LEPOC
PPAPRPRSEGAPPEAPAASPPRDGGDGPTDAPAESPPPPHRHPCPPLPSGAPRVVAPEPTPRDRSPSPGGDPAVPGTVIGGAGGKEPVSTLEAVVGPVEDSGSKKSPAAPEVPMPAPRLKKRLSASLSDGRAPSPASVTPQPNGRAPANERAAPAPAANEPVAPRRSRKSPPTPVLSQEQGTVGGREADRKVDPAEPPEVR